ncbi:MAG: HAD-IC family P-type ATPase [Coriobacteriales bacterium]|jgi:cation transport ATPase
MRYTIVHEIPGRVRVDLLGRMCDHDAASVMELMARLDCVAKCAVYPRTGTLAISYVGGPAERELVLDALALLKLETVIDNRVETLSLAINEDVAFIGDVAGLILKRLFKRMFLPPVIRHIWTVFSAIHFFRLAAKSLAKPALEVATLDAAAIAVSLIRRDFSTASTTMFLLRLGEIMQDHTMRRSQMALVDSLLDVPSDAWRVGTDGVEELVATDDIEVGDLIRVRMGSRIPLDGRIVAGTADVNQATLTGEALAVHRETGDSVFAGTVVESGEVTIEATTLPRETKLRQVVALVEQSDSLKSQRQSNMEHMADRLVPWYFLTSGLVYAVTRDPVRASAALMVDYSCVLKLSGSIAALSAMSQGVEHGFTVKGARWFEAVAEADTLVFDKTGTLTEGRPIVADVIPLNHWSVTNVLRLAACRGRVRGRPRHRVAHQRQARYHRLGALRFRGRGRRRIRRAARMLRRAHGGHVAALPRREREGRGHRVHQRPPAPGHLGRARRAAWPGVRAHHHAHRR